MLVSTWWPHPAHGTGVLVPVEWNDELCFTCSCGERLSMPLDWARELGLV